jgi:hypothetical protein
MAVTLRTTSLNATFTADQQSALSEFFKKYQIVVKDWNAF